MAFSYGFFRFSKNIDIKETHKTGNCQLCGQMLSGYTVVSQIWPPDMTDFSNCQTWRFQVRKFMVRVLSRYLGGCKSGPQN